MTLQDMIVCIGIVLGMVVAGFFWPDRTLITILVGAGCFIGYVIFRRT